MFIIKLLSQHVLGIIMPITRRTRVCTATYGVLHWLWWLWLCGAQPQPSHNQCRTPYAAVHTLVLLMMDIMMPETCWDKSWIINITLVASCWSLSLSLHRTVQSLTRSATFEQTVCLVYLLSFTWSVMQLIYWRTCLSANEFATEAWKQIKQKCVTALG